VDDLKYVFPNTDYLGCPHYYYILKLSSEFDTMLCFHQEFWLAPSKSFKERATTKEFSFQFNPSSPFPLPFLLPLVSSSESGGTSSGGGSSPQTSGPASGHSGSGGSGTRLVRSHFILFRPKEDGCYLIKFLAYTFTLYKKHDKITRLAVE
jgi:hypothetical protein